MSAQPSTTADPIRVLRRLVFCLLAALALRFPTWAESTNGLVLVTCVLDTYLPPASDPTKEASVSGVILKVLEPKGFSGERIRFHFDGPPHPGFRRFYEPGLLYAGEIRRSHIGHPGLMCDLAFKCTGLLQPLQPRRPEELGRLLWDRHWNEHYAAAIRNQFGDKVLFRLCYGFLTRPDGSSSGFEEQQAAAGLLLRYGTACDIPISQAIQETFLQWDDALGEWPLYLVRTFGAASVRNALIDLEAPGLSVRDCERLEAWRYWAGQKTSGPTNNIGPRSPNDRMQ